MQQPQRYPLRLIVSGSVFAAILSWLVFAASGIATDSPPSFEQLSICVAVEPSAGVDVSSAQNTIASVAKGASAVLKTHYDETRGLHSATGGAQLPAFGGISVGTTCPHGFQGPRPGTKYGESVRAESVSTASPYNIKLFVLSDSSASSVMGKNGSVRMPYEFACDETSDVCAEVSTALYVRASTANDGAKLGEALSRAAGWAGRSPVGHPADEPSAPKRN